MVDKLTPLKNVSYFKETVQGLGIVYNYIGGGGGGGGREESEIFEIGKEI